MNVLFVCSKNKWRSRTAETIFRENDEHHVKSAGTDDNARIRLTLKLLTWADLIFVMESKHREIINQKLGQHVNSKKIVVLDIPDEYQYMDDELVFSIKIAVAPYL